MNQVNQRKESVKNFLLTVWTRLWAKKWLILGVGGLVGLMAIGLVQLNEQFDWQTLSDIVGNFPESMLQIIGGFMDYTTPYGILNTHLLQMMWIYVGLFVIFVACFALPSEIEGRTIDLVLSKPISRKNFLGALITYLYLFLAGILALMFLFTAVGMLGSPSFQEYGFYWDRLWVAFLMTLLHLGSLVMVAVFASTLLQSSKKSAGVAIVVFFALYFLGVFSGMLPEDAQVVKWASVWAYYSPQEWFQSGNFEHLARDIGVLLGVNAALVVASLAVFTRKDIPV